MLRRVGGGASSARAALFIFQPSWLVFQCLFARGGRRTRPRAVPSFRLLPPVPHPPQLAEGASTKHPEGPPTPPFPCDCMCVCAKFVSRHSLRRGVARVCSCALSSAVEMLGLDVPLTMTRVLRRMQSDPTGGAGCLPPGRFFFFPPHPVSRCCSSAHLKTTRLLKEKKTKAQSCSVVGCCEKCKFCGESAAAADAAFCSLCSFFFCNCNFGMFIVWACFFNFPPNHPECIWLCVCVGAQGMTLSTRCDGEFPLVSCVSC